MLTPNQNEALRLLGAYTAGRYDFWLLSGNTKAGCRAHIMSALAGKRMPQAKSGVNAMTAAFYDFAKPVGDCPAIREDNFRDWCVIQASQRHAAKLDYIARMEA
jgi:hypothetical protein